MSAAEKTAAALIAVAAATITLAACGQQGTSPSAAHSPHGPASSARAPAAEKTARLPNLVGKGLQSAQDTAQAVGFYNLKSHDALGRDRHQILDRDWKVCSQIPKVGSHDTSTTVDLGAVKLDESCPSSDQGSSQSAAGPTMPDFTGKALSKASAALDPSTSIDAKDASGQDRTIIVQSDWQVCRQSPRPGTKLAGQPVTFTAVKFGETCP